MDKKDKSEPLHEDLGGLDVKINRFGQIESNFDIDKVNEFLNKKSDNKKIAGKKGSTGKSDSDADEEE